MDARAELTNLTLDSKRLFLDLLFPSFWSLPVLLIYLLRTVFAFFRSLVLFTLFLGLTDSLLHTHDITLEEKSSRVLHVGGR